MSQLYETEIKVVDIGEEQIVSFSHESPKFAIYVVYTGVHYNSGALNTGVTQFTENVDNLFLKLARDLKNRGEYIDPNVFSLVCSDCGTALQGQIDAVEHAKLSGHSNFT